MARKAPFYAFILLATLMITVAWAQEAEPTVDWNDPASIDIYAEGINDFLDADSDEITRELASQGAEAYNAGEYEQAIQYYLTLAHYGPHWSNPIYNIACCFGLLGDAEYAGLYLERAVPTEFDDLGWIENDPDFDSVRDDPAFAETFELLKTGVEAQRATEGQIIFIDAPVYLRCHVRFPTDYDPTESYKLVVGLHGFGSSPESYIKLWERFAGQDFIFAVPQAPYAFNSGGDVGFSWAWGTGGRGLPARSANKTNDYIGHVVESLTNMYNVENVYLLGFSQGCGFAYQAGIVNHDLLAGVIGFGGWLEEGWFSKADFEHANHLRVFVAHGNEDGVVEFQGGVDAAQLLESHGYDVTFHEFDGAHRVPEQPLQAAEAWMNLEPTEDTAEVEQDE
jgi:predicted esterase